MFNIKPLAQDIVPNLQHKIDTKTKPLGALGKLEAVALKIGTIQQTLTPTLNRPTIVVFAGDHGITAEGVSPYPQAVTHQMVLNFLAGGAAISVFCRQNNIALRVVDAGVNHDFAPYPNFINAKIGRGTQNFLHKPAMTLDQTEAAMTVASNLVAELHGNGCNIIGFGEMGIGNTSSAAAIMHKLTGLPLDVCVGRGTGLDDGGLAHKRDVLSRAVAQHNIEPTPLNVLATFGGFEIAMLTGAMLKSAELGMVLLIDGFISSAAVLVAAKMHSAILEYCIFTHQSDEHGHKHLLEHLGALPLVDLNMRLGEASGVAVTYPLVKSALNFLNKMASFESAQVSQRAD